MEVEKSPKAQNNAFRTIKYEYGKVYYLWVVLCLLAESEIKIRNNFNFH